MLKLQHLLRSSHCAGGILCRYQSTTSVGQKLKESNLNAESLRDFISGRQAEASRSLLVEAETKDVYGQVYHYCEQFGEIKNAFVYTLSNARNMMLLEYKNVDAIKENFKFNGFQSSAPNWPNRVLFVRNSKLSASLSKDAPLQVENVPNEPIGSILRAANTFDDQVNLFYEHMGLTELSVRLRFMTAMQAQVVINEFLDTIFPNAQVYPFGSSINGFGKMGCDIDMVLQHDKVHDGSIETNQMPLMFQGKEIENAEDIKKLEGRQVKCIASLIDYFLPGSSEVNPIHFARVPIVRYNDMNNDCSVDLSVNNLDGFHISEFMYAMGLLDPRIRPFIFMVRQWAKEFILNRYQRKEYFTNFQISYMCLSFLQQLKEPLMPTFEDVMKQIGNSQSKNIGNILRESFIFDLDRFQFHTKNTSTVLELFQQFLNHYATYDLSTYMVTVRTTEKLAKPEPANLFLENVFDSTVPWGGNVSDAECSTLKIMALESLKKLELCSGKPSDPSQDWGLLEIISTLKHN